MTQPRVAVVGGGLGALRSAEALRAAGHAGPVTVYGAEAHLPYTRPPLSKETLAEPPDATEEAMLAPLTFRRRRGVEDVEFRLGATVESADLARRTLRVAGAEEGYDGLVIATGLRSFSLPLPGPEAGRHRLRTFEDCLALRAALTSPRRVVVVGAGFIGTEAACTLTTMGHRVTVVEPVGPPMSRALGAVVGAGVQRHHEAAGITFLVGTGVTAYDGDSDVTGVVLDDGSALPADLVLEAVGSRCNTGWLAGNEGIDLTDGVLTDAGLGVVGAPYAVAVGDLARYPNPMVDDVPRRVEHWSNATDTARRAARTLLAMLGGEPMGDAPAIVPSFWSDQLSLRFQSFGMPHLGAEARVEEGDLADLEAGVLVTYRRGDQHVGTLALNLPPARQRGLRDALAAPN